MRYLKKVQVSALGGTGTIVDSLVSGSDPATNAPSIRAVNEKLGVNNLMFNGDFTNQPNYPTDYFANGWKTENGHPTGVNGFFFAQGSIIDLVSPAFMPNWFSVGDTWKYPYTITVELSIGATPTDPIVRSVTYTTYAASRVKTIEDLGGGVLLQCNLSNPDNKYMRHIFTTTGAIPDGIYIRRIKAEFGSTATPFIPSMRDVASIIAAQELVAGLKVFEFSGTLPADTSGYVAIEGETGYNLSILAAYCYNVTDAQYYEMAKPDVVGASYYRPTLYAHGNLIRIQLDATSVTNYASQAYKIFALGWRA